MACPFCNCKTVYQFDDEAEPQDDRLQRCAACGSVFDLDDHADEDDDGTTENIPSSLHDAHASGPDALLRSACAHG